MYQQIRFFGHDLRDFSDTAALMQELDLIISIDTSVLHLAGALGLPAWGMMPFAADWRWLMQRTDSPWYPTMRLFRPPASGDWAAIIDQVCQELARYLPGSPDRRRQRKRQVDCNALLDGIAFVWTTAFFTTKSRSIATNVL